MLVNKWMEILAIGLHIIRFGRIREFSVAYSAEATALPLVCRKPARKLDTVFGLARRWPGGELRFEVTNP